MDGLCLHSRKLRTRHSLFDTIIICLSVDSTRPIQQQGDDWPRIGQELASGRMSARAIIAESITSQATCTSSISFTVTTEPTLPFYDLVDGRGKILGQCWFDLGPPPHHITMAVQRIGYWSNGECQTTKGRWLYEAWGLILVRLSDQDVSLTSENGYPVFVRIGVM
jgi:hypothetical protein